MFSRNERILLALLAAVQFTHIVDFTIMMPLGPQLIRLFSITPHEFGLLVSVYNFAASIAGLFSAFFTDRFDRKKILVFLYLGFALGTLACGFAQNYPTLLAARALTGAFGGVITSVVFSYVADVIEEGRRGSAMGIVMSAFSVASVLGVPFGLYLTNHFSTHTPFFVLAVLALFVLGGILKWVPSLTAHLKYVAKENVFEPLMHVVRSPEQMKALCFMFLLIFGQFGVIPFISPSLVSNAGFPEADLPLMYLLGGVCSMVASPTVGRLSDKIGKPKMFRISVLLSLIPFYFITNLTPLMPPLVLLTTCSLFLVMSGRVIPAMAMVTSVVPPSQRGSFMSVVSSVQQLASAAGSYAAGLLVVREVETNRLLHYPLVGYVAIVTSLLCFFLIPTQAAQGQKIG